MSEEFIAHALSNGEAGRIWLDSIPDLIKKYQGKWDIQVLPPFQLSYNYVAPSVRKDGTPAVLKIGFPKDREFQTEILALEHFDGQGIERLLEVDAPNAAMLIEHVKPGTPLSEMTDDEEATRTIARVMKKLWKPLPEKHGFITVAEWARAIPELRARFHGETGPLPSHLVTTAEELFTELLATSQAPVLVHGDLHHDNVLSSDRTDYLAIDPKGIAAEPQYEVAAMIRNPYEKLKNIEDLEPLLRRRLEILASELNFDTTRLHKWCLAQTVLSAVWNVEGAKGPEHCVRVAEILYQMKF